MGSLSLDQLLARLSIRKTPAAHGTGHRVQLLDLSPAADESYPVRFAVYDAPAGFAPTLATLRGREELVYAEDRLDDKGRITGTWRIAHRDRATSTPMAAEVEADRTRLGGKGASAAKAVGLGTSAAQAFLFTAKVKVGDRPGVAATAVLELADKVWTISWTTFGDDALVKADQAAFETLLHGMQLAIPSARPASSPARRGAPAVDSPTMVEAAVEIQGLQEYRVRERRRASAACGTLRPGDARRPAITDVSFRIEPGERVALWAPTRRQVDDAQDPDRHPPLDVGHGARPGLVPWKDRTALGFRIGTVFGQRSQLWWHLPASDTFELLAKVYEVEPRVHRDRHDRLVEAFKLADLLGKPVRQLSLGERMRCELVASLLHAPELLVLDEPTIGLDVTAKAVIRDLVRERSVEDGCTVLLASHDTGDMERVCDRVLVIHHGRLLLDRPVATLKRTYLQRKVVTLATVERDVLIDLRGVKVRERAPHRTVLEVDTAITPVEAVVSAALAATRLEDLRSRICPWRRSSRRSTRRRRRSGCGRGRWAALPGRGAVSAAACWRNAARAGPPTRCLVSPARHACTRGDGVGRTAFLACSCSSSDASGIPWPPTAARRTRAYLWYLAVTEWVLLSSPVHST
jgi:ABC-2 type transport system ATP-binding protein